jgi:multiple sugar transport system substrate-binding protein
MGTESKPRRDFLKTVGTGAVGLAVGAVAGYGASAAMAPPPGGVVTTVTETVTAAGAGPAVARVPGATAKERAVNGVKALKAAGKIPDGTRLATYYYAGSRGTITVTQEEWEAATGIPLDLVEVPVELAYDKIMMEATGKTGTPDCFITQYRQMGDFVRAKVIEPLDEWVNKYDPVLHGAYNGYIYPVDLQEATYAGKVWAMPIDCDTQTFYYRKDLLQSPKEQEGFEKQYGYPLPVKGAETWDQYHDMIEYFNRPPNMYGTYEHRSLYWSWMCWEARYGCKKYPVNYYFDDDMNPLIASPEGVKAIEQYVATVPFQDPDWPTITWAEAYPRMASGQGFAYYSFPSFAKYANTPEVSKVVGKLLYADPPGEYVDTPAGKKLLRTNSMFGGWSMFVNAYGKNKELAYLYAQWQLSPENMPLVSTDPGSFADPSRYCQVYDPRQTGAVGSGKFPFEYMQGTMGSAVDGYIHRTSISVPDVLMEGNSEMYNVIDKYLSSACHK